MAAFRFPPPMPATTMFNSMKTTSRGWCSVMERMGVALSVDVSRGRGRTVLADRNLLESLLLTLLSNALDAVLPGGEIRVFCRQISAGRIGFRSEEHTSELQS